MKINIDKIMDDVLEKNMDIKKVVQELSHKYPKRLKKSLYELYNQLIKEDEGEQEGSNPKEEEKEEREEMKGKSKYSDSQIRKVLIAFFKKNSKPSDDLVHELAEKLGVDPHTLEEHIYKLLSSKLNESSSVHTILKRSGESRNESDTKYNPKELWVGTQVEKEHVGDEGSAKEIAKDHLKEIPDYYTRLLKMEKRAGQEVPTKWLKRLNITEDTIFELLSEIPIRLEKVKAKDIDKEILRLSMIAELDAASVYEQMANLTNNPKIRKILLDIAKEEKTHTGEFQMLLKEIDPEYAGEIEIGEKEARNKLK